MKISIMWQFVIDMFWRKLAIYDRSYRLSRCGFKDWSLGLKSSRARLERIRTITRLIRENICISQRKLNTIMRFNTRRCINLIATYMQRISFFPPWKAQSLPHLLGSSMMTRPRLPHNTSCVPVSLISRCFISKIGGSVGRSFWKIDKRGKD